MKITVIENAKEIREVFIEKFTMPWEEFLNNNKEWAEAVVGTHSVTYEQLLLWTFMDHRAISFEKSLACLRSLLGEVYFMSENDSYPNCCGIEINGVEYKGGVAKMNAKELADLIEYEWYETYRLYALDRYLEHMVLPADLYVFDESMEHLLVFTHETDYWELEDEQPMRCAASRFCMMYGFELPEAVTYEKIRTLLKAELSSESSFEMELSYSCSMYFRQLTVSKRINDDYTGYAYRFDYDSTDTVYPTWEEAENAKIFNGLSFKEVSKLKGVRFDIIKINGNDYNE